MNKELEEKARAWAKNHVALIKVKATLKRAKQGQPIDKALIEELEAIELDPPDPDPEIKIITEEGEL